MPTNRDDFTKATKDLAAKRVGFLCSNPDCRCHTVGPSRESNHAVSSIGVAAHICAAAPGGKRYDVNMTQEERMGIDNCLWLCQTHAHLIDTDDITYPVELLRKWKYDAENYAAAALSDGNFLHNYHAGNGDNLTQLEELFNGMVMSAEFDLMHKILSQYTSGLSEKYDECIVRNKIIWCVYCDREKLQAHINTYIQLPDKSGSNDLLRLFLSLDMEEEQKLLRNFCTEKDLGVIVDLAVANVLYDKLVGKHNPEEPIEVMQKTKDAIDKYLLFTLCKQRIYGLQNSDGTNYNYDSCEVFWTTLWNAFSIASSIIDKSANLRDIESKFHELLKKVNIYDSQIQSVFWNIALSLLLQHKNSFESLYKICPKKVQDTENITSVKLAFDIEYEHHIINIDDLLSYCNSSGDYHLAVQYCEKLTPENECTFLEEHQYLYRKDSRFLYRRIVVHRESFIGDPKSLLQKYSDHYRDDFLFDCMKADFSLNNQSHRDIFTRLKEHNTGKTFFNLNYYAKILSKMSCWDDLIELSKRRLPQELQHIIADNLVNSKQHKCLLRGVEIYQNLLRSDYSQKNVHYNLGVAYNLLGRVEDAKQELKKEYDIHCNDHSLRDYLSLRFETNEVRDDEYLQNAKQIATWNMQNLVGATYAKLGLYDEARKFFLRSLLLNEQENPSITGYWNTCSKNEYPEPAFIGIDTAFTISNGNNTLNFALHRPQILANIHANHFAGYNHYSVQDPTVSCFMYCQIGDCITFNGENYNITTVEYIDAPLCRYALSQIMSLPTSQVISGSSAEEGLENLIRIMKKQNEDQQAVISHYNAMEVRTPLSIFSHQFGKNRLLTWEFLSYINEKPIRNNTLFPTSAKSYNFILAYDSILTLSRLDIADMLPADVSLICPTQVKNQLLLDINEELKQLDESESAGSMQYGADGLRLIQHTPETRRARHRVLVQLNSFLSKLTVAPPVDLVVDDSDMTEFVSEPVLRCETGALALAQNTPDAILITDDQFLSCTATFFGIENAGLAFLASNLKLEAKSLLDVARKLKELNFQNYFPLGLYKAVFDQLNATNEDTEGGELLGSWLLGDQEEASDRHKEIIIALFRDVVRAEEEYLNPGNILGLLAIRFYESMHPGFVESLVREALKNLRIDIVKDDDS